MEDHEREMNLDELLDKLQELNPNEDIPGKRAKIKKEIQIIYEIYEKINNSNDKIDDKNKLNNPYDNNLNPNQNQIDYVLIARMIYYNEKIFKFIPRKIQIISLLLFLEKDKEVGLVQQINTGEGKSCIISFLAVYIAIKEKKKLIY